jgi:hypothetical protein
MKILAGVVPSTEYDGNVEVLKGLRIGYLPQEPLLDAGDTVWENIAPALADILSGRVNPSGRLPVTTMACGSRGGADWAAGAVGAGAVGVGRGGAVETAAGPPDGGTHALNHALIASAPAHPCRRRCPDRSIAAEFERQTGGDANPRAAQRGASAFWPSASASCSAGLTTSVA